MRHCMHYISPTWNIALPQNGKTAKAPVVAVPLFGTEANETGKRLKV